MKTNQYCPTPINIIPARDNRPEFSTRGGLFKSFVRFSILPFLDIIEPKLPEHPARRKLLVAVRQSCRRAFEIEAMHCKPNPLFLPEEKFLHFRKKLSAGLLFGWMMLKIIKKQIKTCFTWMDFSLNFFLKIADRLVFCMFDIKLLIFTQSQDILLIFSQRQKKLPWLGQIQIKYILKFAI